MLHIAMATLITYVLEGACGKSIVHKCEQISVNYFEALVFFCFCFFNRFYKKPVKYVEHQK